MKAFLKTKQELIDVGFKSHYPEWYAGTLKMPSGILKYHIVENLCGQEVEVLDVLDTASGQIKIFHLGREYTVPSFFFKEPLLFKNVLKPKILKIGEHQAKFYDATGTFKFDCSFRDMDSVTATKIAKWVLGCSKK